MLSLGGRGGTSGSGTARSGRRSPLGELMLTPADRATLERWTTRRKTAHGLAMRAEIVLRCSDGCSNSQVARELRLTNTTVGKWRSRFVSGGIGALLDEPRSGAPRRITDDQVEAVVIKTLESTPRDATHWSVRSMASLYELLGRDTSDASQFITGRRASA